jgi:hypothetical protein
MRITDEARQRMTDEVREWCNVRAHGFLLFRPDGTGGAWYSDDSYGFDPQDIRIPLHPAAPEDAEELVDLVLERL